MVIVDTIWKPKVEENVNKISGIKNKIKEKLKLVEINSAYPNLTTNLKLNLGPWEKKYYETLKELKWWEQVWGVYIRVTPKEVDFWVNENEKQAMKSTVHSWSQDTVDSTNAEGGKTNDYDSTVNRIKGTNFHQRGHYFIFYKDGSKEHWLVLYPKFEDSQLVSGHKHKVFDLNFDKPVEKLVDVYTCIGCGAAEGNYFTELHENYNYSSADSWEIIHKNLPFEPWYSEFIKANYSGKVMIFNNTKCMGTMSDVWEGKEIKDEKDKTFDKAYGHIPNSGIIQWKLSRSEKNEVEWINRRIPYHMDKLYGENEFTSYAKKNVYQQIVMNKNIDELFQEKEFVIDYLKDNHNVSNINEQLQKGLKERFWKLIITKKEAYVFLEKWITKIVAENKEKNRIREEITNCENDFDRCLLQNELPTIREIWGLQVEEFIREGKVKELSSRSEIKLTTYNQLKAEVNSLYQYFFDKLSLDLKVENIQQSEHVAQILIEP